MDQIVNLILQDSDQEVGMGSDDDENSDSDWEYEEEKNPKNDKFENSAVISSTPLAKSPLSDGNMINARIVPPNLDYILMNVSKHFIIPYNAGLLTS